MSMVVSNTSPLNYLIQIGAVDLLPQLHGSIHVPRSVIDELSAPAAPSVVCRWILARPDWLVVHDDPQVERSELKHLHRGETAAITLSLSLGASLLLMDDLDGRIAARGAGLTIMGTLGVLDAGARKAHVDFPAKITALLATNFRAPRKLVEALMKRHVH